MSGEACNESVVDTTDGDIEMELDASIVEKSALVENSEKSDGHNTSGASAEKKPDKKRKKKKIKTSPTNQTNKKPKKDPKKPEYPKVGTYFDQQLPLAGIQFRSHSHWNIRSSQYWKSVA